MRAPTGPCEWIQGVFKVLTDRDFPGGAVVKNLPANAGDVLRV